MGLDLDYLESRKYNECNYLSQEDKNGMSTHCIIPTTSDYTECMECDGNGFAYHETIEGTEQVKCGACEGVGLASEWSLMRKRAEIAVDRAWEKNR